MKEYEMQRAQHLMTHLNPSSPEADNHLADAVKRYRNGYAIITS